MNHRFVSGNKSFIILILFFNFHVFASSKGLSYQRTSQCILQTQIGCVYWQSKLQFQKRLDASCFPQDTYLQGRDAKIKISQLQVGDQVLVYGQNGLDFQRIQAWLHRDVDEHVQYRFIEYLITQNSALQEGQSKSNGIFISGMHNIALLDNKASVITYQFAQSLKCGDFLFGYGPYSNSQTPVVSNVGKKERKKGVYAPYTRSGNYFVTKEQNFDQLILVHSFAHVSTKFHYLFDILINTYPPWNVQPSQQSYIHPLSQFLKDLFPSVIEIKKLNQLANQISQTHLDLRHNWDDNTDNEFRENTHGNQRKNFKQQRKIMVIIDKILSMIQLVR